MINLKASRKTGTINVGVNPITNINVNNPPTNVPIISETLPPPPLNYPDPGTFGPSADNVHPNFVSVSPVAKISDSQTTTEVSYQTPEDLEKAALLREINVLKLIIDIQHSNPMIVNKYIIADDAALGKMVGLLCNASEVHLDADDVGVGCVSKKTYRKVHSIYVVVNGETLNLKYDFPAVMKTLKDLHISTKYVF